MSFINRVERAAALPEDSEDERIRKSLLLLSACLISLLALVWVVTYLILGLYAAAAIPFAYQLVSIVSIVFFIRTKRYRVFRFTQLTLMVMLPFLLQLVLGGFVASSGVVLWSLTGAIGALLFYGREQTSRWFVAYAIVLALATAADPLVDSPRHQIPEALRLGFFAMNILGVSLTCYMLFRYFLRERDRAREALRLEQQLSERLLLNVLPRSIADRLKSGEESIADAYPDVSVLFADIAGFTPLAEEIDPHRLVDLLNEVFSTFDSLADERGLEKIKTIGDAYMVAGGVPEPMKDHLLAIADLAVAMRDACTDLARSTGHSLDLRIGIDTGPVVAGVIGRRKFAFDLWGDIVNTASRMESHGVPGGIQVTERAYRGLAHAFDLELRGVIEIKGKGPTAAYLLTGRRESPASQKEHDLRTS